MQHVAAHVAMALMGMCLLLQHAAGSYGNVPTAPACCWQLPGCYVHVFGCNWVIAVCHQTLEGIFRGLNYIHMYATLISKVSWLYRSVPLFKNFNCPQFFYH